ncbi:DinB family protein [Actinospica durhamensis]|uniref:DinB family protein n=1 Tax=Actinospica durhamensis TaxID=1508375 RepID=A0A941EU50_9ACTN|nr:DinB family protein [Actinospica durhamensis]MBR7835119.1 DinB family protein [Actinospica durhamensis]
MATSTTQELVVLLDYAHERLRDRIAGMSDHEYLWEPAPGCWSVRTGQDGVARVDLDRDAPEPPPLTTIAWRLWHIADCLRSYTDRAFETQATPGPGLDWTTSPVAAAAVVDSEWDRFVGHVRKLDQEALERPIGPAFGPYAQDSMHALVLHATDEVIHHGAEVALLRDLYRVTGGRELTGK